MICNDSFSMLTHLTGANFLCQGVQAVPEFVFAMICFDLCVHCSINMLANVPAHETEQEQNDTNAI